MNKEHLSCYSEVSLLLPHTFGLKYIINVTINNCYFKIQKVTSEKSPIPKVVYFLFLSIMTLTDISISFLKLILSWFCYSRDLTSSILNIKMANIQGYVLIKIWLINESKKEITEGSTGRKNGKMSSLASNRNLSRYARCLYKGKSPLWGMI